MKYNPHRLPTYHTSEETKHDEHGRPKTVEVLHLNRHLMPMLRHTGTFVKVKPVRITRNRKLKRITVGS